MEIASGTVKNGSTIFFNNIKCYVEWIMEIIVVKEGLDNLLRRLEHN